MTLDPPGLALTDNYIKVTLDCLIRQPAGALAAERIDEQGVSAQVSASNEERSGSIGACRDWTDIPLRTPRGKSRWRKLSRRNPICGGKAARIAGDAQWAELMDDLVMAFDRFLKRIPNGTRAASR